jgi:hypothetical protein
VAKPKVAGLVDTAPSPPYRTTPLQLLMYLMYTAFRAATLAGLGSFISCGHQVQGRGRGGVIRAAGEMLHQMVAVIQSRFKYSQHR